MNTTALLTTLALAVGLLAAPGAAATDDPEAPADVIRESFTVEPGGTLHVDVDRGNVRVETASGAAVRVEVERRVRGAAEEAEREVLARHEVTIEERGGDVYVQAELDENGGLWGWWGGSDEDRLEVEVRVEVPRRYSVDFATGAGNVQIASLEGAVRGETGAGNVAVGEVAGPVDLDTGAGNVEVQGAARAEVNTGAGNVQLRDVRGRVQARTGAGNISAHITRQPEAPSEVSSGTGNVTVYVSEGVDLSVDASTGIGSAATDFAMQVDEGWMGTSFAGAIGQGGPPLHLSTGMGNVALKRQ